MLESNSKLQRARGVYFEYSVTCSDLEKPTRRPGSLEWTARVAGQSIAFQLEAFASLWPHTRDCWPNSRSVLEVSGLEEPTGRVLEPLAKLEEPISSRVAHPYAPHSRL